MNAPWNGPRYQSWASNTVLSGIVLLILLGVTVAVDALNGPEPPPTYLTGLLGLAGGAFFGAAGSDKSKRESDIAKDAQTAKTRMIDVNETAIRAEDKADKIGKIVADEHPRSAHAIPDPLIPGKRDKREKGNDKDADKNRDGGD